MDNRTEVPVEGGKYTFVIEDGEISALRYGKPWLALYEISGVSNMLIAMARELEQARKDLVAGAKSTAARDARDASPPEWIPYGKTFAEFRREDLAAAGVQIETKRSTWLIGDISELGGSCECCRWVRGDEVVLRYRQLVAPELL